MCCLLRVWIYSTIERPIANFLSKASSAARGDAPARPARSFIPTWRAVRDAKVSSLIGHGVFTSVPDLTREVMCYIRRSTDATPSLLGIRGPGAGNHSRNHFTLHSPLMIIRLLIMGRHHPRRLIPCVYGVTPIRPRTTSCGCWNDQCRRTRGRCTIRAYICSNTQVLHVLSP